MGTDCLLEMLSLDKIILILVVYLFGAGVRNSHFCCIVFVIDVIIVTYELILILIAYLFSAGVECS